MAEPDLLRFTTAGSVDDGKSTLIGRLLHDAGAIQLDQLDALRKARGDGGAFDLSLVTDGLRAEREQGITIDVAYRYFATPKRRFIIADTPGHIQYTRNMATGASTADLAVILIDARLGIQTQSKRHAFIVSLLGVPRVVVTVNKMDLVGYDRSVFERIREEYSAFAARLRFTDLAFIPVSALEGDNVVSHSGRMPWFDGQPLLPHLESVYVAGDANLVDFRFPVQRVVRADDDFRGYAGQVVSGVARAGDEVVVLPSGQRTRIARIAQRGPDLPAAFPPQSVTLCLADDVDVSRGDLIAHPNNVPSVERTIEAMAVWMSDEPLRAGRVYFVKHTTRVVKATCSEIVYRVNPDTLRRETADTLALNEIGRVRFTLFQPLFVDEYRKNRGTGAFILIDPASNATAGAGMIIERKATRGEYDVAADGQVSRNVSRQVGKVAAEDRARVLGQLPLTVWLTGLSGSGKSTIAHALERRLMDAGRACYVLDGDNLRHGLNRDLGFSPEARRENVRRVAEMARLMNDAGLIVITALISPYREDRAMARRIVGDARFLETYLSADIAACERRDPRGLYAKARRGEIADFTGVSAPYEVPSDPGIVLDTDGDTAKACVDALFAAIERKVKA
ncbi:MAG TPA: adenylyl-sulfate kinase [Casimicrobiaceae bacterium]|nr:adenylyl-sulfate kinase [Casimicrobiaceae bacterium]